MPQIEKPASPAVPESAPKIAPKDAIAAAIAAVATDAKTRAEEYVKATAVPGGGE